MRMLWEFITKHACAHRSKYVRTELAATRDHIESMAYNVSDGNDAVRLVRRVSSTVSDDTDALVECLIKTYRYISLSEQQLQTLSLLQQQYERRGDAMEYATTTLWVCAMESAMDSVVFERWAHAEVRRMRHFSARSCSCPARLCDISLVSG